MTKHEKLMYDILSRISETDAPIIFKGALITKLVLSEKGFDDIQRMTKDIDANWIGEPPTMEILSQTINTALGDMQNKFFVEATREYGQNRSAGLCIREKETGDKIISMDIDIKLSNGVRTYYFGEACIKGVLVNEILADKISTISSDSIYKNRTKDMIDVYSLAHCVQINTLDIVDMCNKNNRKIQSFNAFYNKIPEIEHAYNKLKGVIGKPEFSIIYDYLSVFIQPFTDERIPNKIWQLEKGIWLNLHEIELNKVTISRNQIRANADRVKSDERSSDRRDKHRNRGNEIG